MANNTEVLIIDGVEYTLIDSTAVHTVDSGLSTSSSNPVRNSVITAEVNKKPTLLKFGPYTATLTGEYYTFPFSYIDIAGIAASHDGIAISFSSSSAFRPNSTLIAFKNEASLLNGVNVNAYSGTLSEATTIDSNTFICLLPTSGTSSGGTGYIKAASKIADAINALDATISGLGPGKTITALLETNGVISATASNISIAGSQVTSGTIAEARLPSTVVKKSDELLTTNPFAPDSMKGPYISKIDNAFYAAPKRWTITSTPTGSVDPLFNGDYESVRSIAAGTSCTFNMKFDTESNGYFPGYPYGYILVSFYDLYIPASVTGRAYCNYESHGIGWHDIDFSIVPDSTARRVTYRGRQAWYNISEIEITVTADASHEARVVQIEMHLDRPNSARNPFLSKYAAETLYYNLTAPSFTGNLRGELNYGTCATAAGTAAKVVTCAGFVLKAGVRISVRFTNGSTSTATMQLNVNGTGAKNCGVYLYNGTWQTYANRCEKNTILEFVYDGTYWVTITPYALRNYAGYNSRLTSANVSLADFGLQYFLATSAMVTGKPPVDAAILNMNWDNGTIWGHQLAVGNGTGRVFTRAQNGSATWGDWKELPRLSSTPTDGQIIVYDAQSGNGMVKGISYDHHLYPSSPYTDIDADTLSFSISNDELTAINDYMSSAISDGYLAMAHVNFSAPLPGSDTNEAAYIAHSASLDESDLKWVFSGTVYDSVDKTTYPFTFSYPIASTGPVTATVKLNRASSGGSLNPVEDTSVFLSRVASFGENKYKFPSLVGGTVAWNQLAALVASSWTKSAPVSISITGNTIRVTSTSATSSVKHASLPVIANHVYLSSGTVVSSTTTTSRFGFFNTAGTPLKILDNNTSQTTPKTGSILYKPTASTDVYALRLSNGAAADVYADFTDIQLIDLTLALGPTIADYIYSLEQATTGAGVNWFKQYFPKSYYPYNAGALVSVNPTGAETIGVNLFDKSKIVAGYISDSNGNFVSNAAYKATDYISVIGNVDYYIKSDQTSAGWGAWYDSSKAYISGITGYISGASSSKIYSAPANAAYMRLTIASSATGDPDTFSVSVSNSLYNGTYYPYTHHSYPISPVELRGILKLDVNNKLYCDGDVRASDGTVTRKYGQSALSALSWQKQTYQSVDYYIAKADPEYKANVDAQGNTFGYCTAYTVIDTTNVGALTSGQMSFYTNTWGSGKCVTVRDDSISSVSELVTKLTGNGEIIFKKKNPTTESSAALPVPQVVYDGGIESYIDERDVQMPVGQDATYMDATSAIGKLMDSGLVPSSGGGGSSESEGTFTVTDGLGSSDTWSYYKIGKQVTVSGKYTGSSTTLSLQGLPFTVKFKQAFFLPVQITSPSFQLYSCQVTLTAGAKTIGTYGYGSNPTSSWLSFAQAAGTQITFSYITDD